MNILTPEIIDQFTEEDWKLLDSEMNLGSPPYNPPGKPLHIKLQEYKPPTIRRIENPIVEEMSEKDARCILDGMVNEDNSLDLASQPYVHWPVLGDLRGTICLDGHFDADDLEALAWWSRHFEVLD